MSRRGLSWVEQAAPQLEALVDAFRLARGDPARPTNLRGRVLLITGAGCSASAGIPTARQVAQKCCVDLAVANNLVRSASELGEGVESQALTALTKLAKHSRRTLPEGLLFDKETMEASWSVIYEHLFSGPYRAPAAQKEVIEWALAQEQGLNWAHACIGELMARRYVHTVLTVNFDLLALEGAVRAGVIPAIADGFEALSRVDGAPAHPQLVYLHGTRHNYTLRNAATQIAPTPAATRAVAELIRRSTCILVVGYSANDSGLSQLLLEALGEFQNQLVWTGFEPLKESLSAQARRICDAHHADLLLDVDADALFRELLRRLGHGSPEWILDPLAGIAEAGERLREGEDADVQSVVMGFRTRIVRCRALLQAHPEPVSFEIAVAANHRLAGHQLEAIAMLRDLQSEHPESLEILRALGVALLATRKNAQGETSLLREAVTVLEKHLEQSPREANEDAWATAQTMLGRAEATLGDIEGDKVLLEAAVASFEAAMEITTRERNNIEWARTQTYLAGALTTLGHQEAGTAPYEAAVMAYRSALEVRTRQSWPLEWATTKTNLGYTLTCLGGRGPGSALLEAVDVLREALDVNTREERPLAWARTQQYMGEALAALGDREEDIALLEKAEEAIRAALEERTRKRAPFYWALTQSKLGGALSSLGRTLASQGARQEAKTRFEEAARALRPALEVFPETSKYAARARSELLRVEQGLQCLAAPTAAQSGL